jgi:type VI secretion system protein ImpL
MRWPAFILGLICLPFAIWFGFLFIPLDLFQTIWFRATLIGVYLLIVFGVVFFKWRRRRKKADEIEQALIPVEPEGDGKVLAEKMSSALSTLKKSGGKSYLYDLPWYIIIGPPGAGKTTALKNSGIEFPLAGNENGVVEGFGGTRYCDWWFAEEAILIDTAGRYTTQDSDKTADQSSWQSFLDLLKRSRPNQPINGVLLAFSVEDMMRATEEDLAAHAATVRARLAEIHETLRIDFPVYVLFTKCDLISGFREYFSSFNLNRRKSVWGVTFQTKDRKLQTFEQVPVEFDKLVSRLSDEVIDRLSEEPDGISRISIFGLPGQMALLRDNVSDFLRRVFEPTRYKTNAILRGFYFTSGTQEGTPIDQVLGAMSQNTGGGGAFAPSFMSGQGKSYFIHDLLRRVIFAERDWVSHDIRAVRRTAILRGLALSLIAIATIGTLSAFGLSYWQNLTLVRTAQTEAEIYQRAAQQEINRTEIDDSDLTPILAYLEQLRMMPAGYGVTAEPTIWEGFGLSQRSRLQSATKNAYDDALEQMLRPRLVLDVERRLPKIRADGDTAKIYRALKVYMLLGGQGGHTDDDAIKSWFDDIWREDFTGIDGIDKREQLSRHLDAMLQLDDTREIAIPLDDTAITSARSAIVQMSVADQAYALITERAKSANLPDFNLVEQLGNEANIVFATSDGQDLSTIAVPGLFTYEGYWGFFFGQLSDVKQGLEDDKWVLGEQAGTVDFDNQLAGLDQALQSRYQQDFVKAWQGMFDSIKLANMSADKPRYDALGAASAPFSSPILLLVKAVVGETSLTREFKQLEGMDATTLMAGATDPTGAVANDVGSALANRFRSRSTGVQRILLDALANNSKSQERVNGSADSLTRPVERIEEQFADWQVLLEGDEGKRPIDIVLADLEAVRSNLRLADSNPGQSAALLPQLLSNLTRNNSRLPATVRDFINDAETDFRTEATDATLNDMNRALTNDITFNCRENIKAFFPFSNSQRQVPTGEFGKFFGPGGDMDVFFNTYLANHVIRTDDGLAVDPASPLADRLSPAALRQFDRAEKIRRAFFANGGTAPEVQITLTHVASHSSIEQAQLEINGTNTITAPGDPPKTVSWPGQGASTTLQIFPTLDRESSLQLRGGQWTFVSFLRQAASTQVQGNTVRATFQIGGRSITYDFGFNAVTNPFTMSELSEFDCPQSLD